MSQSGLECSIVCGADVSSEDPATGPAAAGVPVGWEAGAMACGRRCRQWMTRLVRRRGSIYVLLESILRWLLRAQSLGLLGVCGKSAGPGSLESMAEELEMQ